MKYLQLTIYYEKAFENLYSNHNFRSSIEVLKSIEKSYLESHRWPYYLDKRKFSVKNILVNNYLFQKLWVEENGVKIGKSKNWYYEVVYHQIKKYKPEILFITSDSFFSNNFLKKIKLDFPFIKKTILWQGVFLSNKNQFLKLNYVDHVMTCSNDIASQLKNVTKVDQIFFAFDQQVLNELPKISKKNELLFLGSIFLERNIHGGRAKLISDLASEFEFLKIHSNTHSYSFKNYIKNFFFKLSKISDHKDFNLPLELKFYKNLINIRNLDQGGNFFGIKQYRKLNESQFILNKHLNGINSASNIRIFEATGVGSCLVSDYFKDLNNLFDLENEIVSYKNIEELKEKVNYLRSNTNKAIEIGHNAQKKVLSSHTFDKRIFEFEALVTKNI